MSWYGKAFYFVELPRRFMVSIWGIPVFWKILPEYWMAIIIAIGCIAYDVFITSRAPDLLLKKEDVRTKLAKEGRLYFLTKKELVTRIVVTAAIFCALVPFLWYWFTHNQQPTLFTRVITALFVLLAVAYISKIGIKLRTKEELPSGEAPFTFDSFPIESKKLGIFLLGWPVFIWAGVIIIYVIMWGMGPSKVTGGLGFTGGFLGFICSLLVGYTLFIGNIIIMPMAIIERKIYSQITKRA